MQIRFFLHIIVYTYSPHPGRLSRTHSAPYPTSRFGYFSNPGSSLAPRRRYAFTFSPYKNRSFPLTIPHYIKSADAPVTKGVAKEVPLTVVIPPPTAAVLTFTPGATRSGFVLSSCQVYPLPEKGA